MFAAVDVQYTVNDARAGVVGFQAWSDARPTTTFAHSVSDCEPYVPGQFFRREMPVIVDAIKGLDDLQLLIIDGYVDLDERGAPGLGRHLFDHFGGELTVVGVAKSPFRKTNHAQQVYRGDSQRPLYVTAAGMRDEQAAKRIAGMHGDFRIPYLIKLADSIARGAEPAATELPGS